MARIVKPPRFSDPSFLNFNTPNIFIVTITFLVEKILYFKYIEFESIIDEYVMRQNHECEIYSNSHAIISAKLFSPIIQNPHRQIILHPIATNVSIRGLINCQCWGRLNC